MERSIFVPLNWNESVVGVRRKWAEVGKVLKWQTVHTVPYHGLYGDTVLIDFFEPSLCLYIS